jgi:hypothetical protein
MRRRVPAAVPVVGRAGFPPGVPGPVDAGAAMVPGGLAKV